jgi:glyoxylase-like metal-dependent hydrolase (beta-lactamase superfamily II)
MTFNGVERLANPLVNWYLVEADDGVTAVDAGFPTDYKRLKEALGARELKAVVLTHGHVDHVGFAERARRELGATVHIAEPDVKIARSPIPIAKSEANPLKYVLRYGATRRLYLGATLRGAALGQKIKEYETFAGGDELPVPGRPRVVASPGHTFGHTALHFADRDVLISGDALVTLDPYTGRTGPRLVARAATADSARARASLDALAATGASVVLPGHGEPWEGGAEEAVRLAKAEPVA